MPPKHRACHVGLTYSQAREQQRPRPYEFRIESSLIGGPTRMFFRALDRALQCLLDLN